MSARLKKPTNVLAFRPVVKSEPPSESAIKVPGKEIERRYELVEVIYKNPMTPALYVKVMRTLRGEA